MFTFNNKIVIGYKMYTLSMILNHTHVHVYSIKLLISSLGFYILV